jgi:epoxyqueuosine reductase
MENYIRDRSDLPRVISKILQEENIDLFGITPASYNQEREKQFKQWLKRGFYGSMNYLQNQAGLKFHPEKIMPGCKSILFFGINYYQKQPHEFPALSGRVALYAWGRDYHKILIQKLKRIIAQLKQYYPEEDFRAYSDSTPLAEKHFARAAGLGFQGKNTILINKQFGTRFLLAEILTTKDFKNTSRTVSKTESCPPGCTACMDSCPTKAILKPYVLDASRCISHLTIELKKTVDMKLIPLNRNWLYGCDICQEVCPFNRDIPVTKERGFLTHRVGPYLSLKDVLKIKNDEEYTERFKGTSLMHIKRPGLVKNALICAASQGAHELLEHIRPLKNDSEPLIREYAQWCLEKIKR